MDLKDILVMDVPITAMKEILRINKVKAKGISTEEYADSIIADTKTAHLAPVLADEFRFAGKTVVSLCVPDDSFPNQLKSIDKFEKKFIEINGESIFKSRKRITLEKTPLPILAYKSDGKIIIEFSYLGNEQRFLDNFEIKKRHPQLINYVIVHFNPFMVEVRASVDKKKEFLSSLVKSLGISTDIQWIFDSILGEKEIELLAKKLTADLKGAKHKMTSGIYDTKEVKANPQTKDLSNEQDYLDEFAGIPAETKTFRFSHYHTLGFNQDITMTITKKGGLWFRTTVGEESINYVIQSINEVRKEIKKQSTLSIKKAVNQ